MSRGILRRYAPTLALERQRIGRCADLGAHAVAARIRPGLGSRRIGAHRIVAVQADGHAELARQRLRAAQLFVRQPLQVGIEFDFLRVGGREPRRRAAVHVPDTPSGQLSQPDANSQGRAEIPVERIEPGMHLQKLARRRPRRRGIAAPGRCRRQMPIPKIAIQQRENLEFEVRHAAVIDPFTVAQLAEPPRRPQDRPIVRAPPRNPRIPAPAAPQCTEH